MMNGDNKRRIDAARKVLVGVIPDPKGQVEQITTALIYKYLAVLDERAVDLGGRRSYFVGKYAKFSWTKLLSPTLEGDKRLSLYRDAMESMGANRNLPEIFKQMLRGAPSPFSDARVLKLFLKAIDELDCRHTEDLGNAYEHLLSIMGTQRKAGQFRTPRNIIDFIVAVVNPQIGERILDPACGSAGFLVAAHEHIMRANTGNEPGDKLSTAQKRNLPKNISGRDIDLGMTRLAIVNLYLHGVKLPQVRVYDTLSDNSLWDNRYEIILANPPFMTPQGSIQPHGKFAVRASRAEVLFVDYIAEHLSPQGRAGIIVPEGVVSQSGQTYKELRKKLVEGWGLYAVASLPAGIFNPYAPGAKTSVLFLDRKRKNSASVLFVKVENDGFNLGARRLPIDKNDLPEAIKIIHAYSDDKLIDNDMALVVDKNRITEGGEYSLVADQYREVAVYTNTKYPMVKLEEQIDVVRYTTKIPKSKYSDKGNFPIIDQSKNFIAGYWDNTDAVFRITNPIIAFGDHTKCVKYIDFDFVLGADGIKLLSPKPHFNPKFFYFICRNLSVKDLGYSRHYKELKNTLIPLPPLEVQEEISVEISGYEKVRDNAQAVVDNWRPVVNINPDWQMVKLEAVCKLIRGVTYSRKDEVSKNGKKILRANNIDLGGNLNFNDVKFINKNLREDQKLVKNDIFICLASGSKSHIGKVAFIEKDTEYYFGGFMGCVRTNEKVFSKYLYNLLNSQEFNKYLSEKISGVNINNLNSKILYNYQIPLPSITEQKRIAAEIESEQQVVNGCRVLVEKMERKIANKIAEIWKAKK